jgi:hypothetical protein
MDYSHQSLIAALIEPDQQFFTLRHGNALLHTFTSILPPTYAKTHVQTIFMLILLLRPVKLVTTIALAALYPTILRLVIPASQGLIELSSTQAVCVTVAILTTGMDCLAGIVLWSIPIV